ncbi:PREDICTED: hexosaminidase D-like isoform X2 [Gavialis gangeticus]|uniref:hexosaminidase D-like isoform X2 n=1 Tax=Gavialis gangeticus TaxID=94835 RepID=UPI00092E5009|nr:PREDICTED: hexosaminidase D-like isoform X2 [Gavialis gangeticus]
MPPAPAAPRVLPAASLARLHLPGAPPVPAQLFPPWGALAQRSLCQASALETCPDIASTRPAMSFKRNQKLHLLRLAVLLVVALAGIRFLFRDSFTLELHKHISKDSDFWGNGGDVLPEPDPRSQPLDPEAAQAAGPKQEARKQLSKDFSATEMRLVHLDLKGAAPKVSYLEQLFPLLSRLGANGVLIEYEDMFPFKGELGVLRAPYTYSEDDLERIQQLAQLNQLEVVPLVQTFGHVEFILKHDQYRHLREVERFPNSFNPHVPDTLVLLKSILAQVMDKHRRASWIHIGADEVFHLGEGTDSKNWLNRNQGDVGRMYLNHIKEVVSFLVSQYRGLRVLLWDDMLRKINVATLQESGIAKYAAPMVWYYAPDFEAEQIGSFISKYADSGFQTVWFASAFKGTTGPAQQWTPLSNHLNNHLSWLKVIQAMPKFPAIKFQGIALTGWQRYDHYSVLCELLPVGIPSLAVCLQTLVNGGFTDATKKKVLDVLGFQNIHLEKSTCDGGGGFPGSEIYRIVEQINGHLRDSVVKILEEESAIKGWFSHYHRKHQFGNPRNMESFGSKVLKVQEDWENLVQTLRAHLESIFFPDLVEEWMEENINPYLDRLRRFVKDYHEVIRLNARPKVL